MTRLEQETYEVLEHCLPRITDALERIARALEHTVVIEDTINRQYQEFLNGLKCKEGIDGDNVQEARTE